jgi:hypothetical protein
MIALWAVRGSMRMLQALRAGKIDQWLTKSAWQIEDLLTAVVFGSCDYAGRQGWESALHPFLAQAVDTDNRNRKLDDLLPSPHSIHTVSYEFWPDLERFEHNLEDAEAVHTPVTIRAASPELIIRLEDDRQKKFFILIEVKLNVGKSGGPSVLVDEVADQLAKYWMQLKRLAKAEGGKPLAAVYVTPSSFPADEIRETRAELMKCGEERAPLFWISWRDFVLAVENHAIDNQSSPPPLIYDVCQLLRDRWGLVRVEPPRVWPVLSSLPKISALSIDFPWRPSSSQVSSGPNAYSRINPMDEMTSAGVWQFTD